MERPNELRPYFVTFKPGRGVQFNGTYPKLPNKVFADDKTAILIFATDQQDAEDVATYQLNDGWEGVTSFEEFCLTRSFMKFFTNGMVVIPPDWRHKGCDEPMDFLPPKPSCCVVCGGEFEEGNIMRLLTQDRTRNVWWYPADVDKGYQTQFRANPDDHKRAHVRCLTRLVENGLMSEGDLA